MDSIRNPLTVLDISAVLCRTAMDFSPVSVYKTSQNHHLFWVERGSVICHTATGKTLVSKTVLIIPKGVPYHLVCSGPCKIWSIAFDTKEDLQDTVWSSETPFPTFPKQFSLLEKSFREKELCWQYRLFSSFYSILETLGRRHLQENELDDPLSYEAQRYLRAHFAEHGCKVEDAAAHCNITRQYLRKIFVRRFQMTPMQYLNQLRIERARELLTVTALSLDEVAIRSGFADHSMFCKTFKEKVGMTPGIYRSTHSI